MIATGLVIFAVIWPIDQAAAFEASSRKRKTLLKFVGIFVAIFVLNLVWPYGTAA
jgi:hypothetical protein